MANETKLDNRLFFHTVLFAYQKKMKEILGEGEAVFIHPILDTINLLRQYEGLELIEGKHLEEVFSNFSKKLVKTGAIDSARFEPIHDEKFIFHIEGCTFAKHSHSLLNPKDAVCPFALVAMSIFESVTGKRVKVTDTQFNSEGGKTVIEPIGIK